MSSYIIITPRKPLGAQPDVAYSAAWYFQFSVLGRRLSVMGNEPDFLDDPAFLKDPEWLQLPIAKREIAQERFKILRDYERLESPTDRDAQVAAAQIGVSTSHFYRLRQSWQETYDIYRLLPYGLPGATRKPKLDSEVARAVRELVRRAIEDWEMRTPKEILHFVHTNWDLQQPIPSHMTIRKRIALALDSLSDSAGRIDMVWDWVPIETLESANRYGDVILVDHTGLKTFVASDGGPVRPFLTLAIDLYSRAICGVHVAYGLPGPRKVTEVLRDVVERSKKLGEADNQVTPRLVFSGGTQPSWKALISQMKDGSNAVTVQTRPYLTFGDAIRRIIGRSLGKLELMGPVRRLHREFDPRADALVSLDELKELIEIAVNDFNKERLRDVENLPRLEFDSLESAASHQSAGFSRKGG